MAQIFNALKSLIEPELGKISATLGESESKVSTASHAILGSLLAKVAGHGNNEGLISSMKMAGQSNILNDLGHIFSGKDAGHETHTNGFLKTLLGEHADHFVSNVSAASGISLASAGRLTGMIGSTTSAFLGKKLHEGTSPADLVKELDKEKESFLSAVPAGVGAALGLPAVHHEATHHSQAHHAAAMHSDKDHIVHRFYTGEDKDQKGAPANKKKAPENKIEAEHKVGAVPAPVKKKGFGWLLWLLLLLVLLLLLLFGIRSCRKRHAVGFVETVAVETVVPAAPAVTPPPATTAETGLTLPNGTMLNVTPGGMEMKMVEFLNSDLYKNATDADLKKHWFEFDEVDFVRGSPNEFMNKAASDVHLANIATILKAFPTARIRIGGHADKTGTSGYNKELSLARAIYIDRLLDDHGIEPQRMVTEGFGDEQAIFPATASAEESARDRDIAFRFTK